MFLFIFNSYCSLSTFSSSTQPLLLFVLLFYLIEHWTPPLTPILLTYVVCLRLLKGCCDSFPRLHSSLDSLLGLFLHLYCRTKVYTFVSKKVNLCNKSVLQRKFKKFLYCHWVQSFIVCRYNISVYKRGILHPILRNCSFLYISTAYIETIDKNLVWDDFEQFYTSIISSQQL